MSGLTLRYGSRSFEIDIGDPASILRPPPAGPELSDIEIGRILEAPMGALPIEETVSAGDSMLLVVPDATRNAGTGRIVDLLVRRSIAAGIRPFDIRVIFATGIHRRVTPIERNEILTPFITQRIKCLDHEARDLAGLVSCGETKNGIPVLLNQALFAHDHVIAIGGISFHYFAGFTGGRKLICPGLAGSRTIAETHRLAFDPDARDRAVGVGPGVLDGNPVNDAFIEAAGFRPPTLLLTSFTNERGGITDLYAGDWLSSHRSAATEFARNNTMNIERKRPVVIGSCGGSPYDVNLIQAHKSLDVIAKACTDGGTIVLVAECGDGLGRSDLMKWFDLGTSEAIAEELCQRYQVNGQTAWNLRRITERFDVRIMTSLPDEIVTALGARPIGQNEIEELSRRECFAVPAAAGIMIEAN